MLKTIKRFVPKDVKRYVRQSIQCWKLRGSEVECPICGFHAKHFADDSWHARTRCPRCRSDTRHRLLVSALSMLPQFGNVLNGKRVLHFAPEPVLRNFLKAEAGEYVTADLARSDVDLKLDMTKMQAVPSCSFDCCIACDVLEHIEDDRAAFAELFRVLKPGGVALITVPQRDDAENTYEDSTITTREGRTNAFGQFDHVRFYGADILGRMNTAGFHVNAYNAQSFPEDVVKQYVLYPPVLSRNPLATNFRRLYLCRRN